MAAQNKYAHRVKAALVVVRVPGSAGGEVYLRRGRPLPDSVESSEIKRLVGLGLVEKFEVVGDGDGDTGEGGQTPPAGSGK